MEYKLKVINLGHFTWFKSYFIVFDISDTAV